MSRCGGTVAAARQPGLGAPANMTSPSHPSPSALAHLLAPLELRSLTLRNRLVMGAMHTRLETLDRPHERLAAFYAARARGEVGLILTGGYAPSAAGLMEPDAPLLSDESQLGDHHAIVGAVHGAGGKIALQILHAGRYAKHPQC